ncbi:MAG TPA: response regulator [Opitutaceae bacterium]|jgi:PAS domain S-box-containing protein|nr:response regulator [Opitutaceae bacterium]
MEAENQNLGTALHPWTKWSVMGTIAIVTIALVGWVTGQPILTTFLPGGAPMFVNTALCLLLSCAGFLAAERKRRKIARACAAAVLLISGLTLVEYALGRSFGLDELFWKYNLSLVVAYPGRMAVPTALGLILTAISISLLHMTGRRTVSWFFAFAGGSILALALLPLFSYFAAIYSTQTWVAYRGTSIPTGLCLGLLASALLRRSAGDEARKKVMLPLLALALAILTTVGIVSEASNSELVTAYRWVAHTHEVNESIDHVVAAMSQFEASTRAYCITGDAFYSQRADAHRDDVIVQIDALERLVADNPRQHARARALRSWAQQKFELNNSLVQARRAGDLKTVAAIVDSEPRVIAPEASRLTTEMHQEEESLLVQRQAKAAAVEQHTRSLQLLGSLTAVALVVLALVLAQRATTAQQRIESVLRQSEERFHLVAEAANDAIVIADYRGKIISCNRAAEQMFGYAMVEVIEQPFALLMPLRDREKHQEGVKQLNASGVPQMAGRTVELHGLRKDGTEFPLELSLASWKTAEGPFFGGIMRDITLRKKVEDELRAASAAAQESVRLKSQFLANMSHEIRTPMNGVVGMINLLIDTKLTLEQSNLANTVRTSADSLLHIINDILDFSKIEAGLLAFEALPFDLREPVESCLGILAEKAHGKGLELAYLIDENVPTQLIGDAARLHQILINLVGNAVKFTAHGEVVLSVARESEGNRRVRLRFSVRDTGIGVDAKAKGNLFQAFKQADSSTTRKFGGTGLGLAISRQLVQLMGGEIQVDSELGHGSTFWFTAEFPLQEPTPKVVAARASLAGLRALVVDDNETNREILRRQLASWRIEATSVASGAEALPALRKAAASGVPFHLGILDMMMPEMSGLELAAALRAEPGLDGLKLIMLTSMGHKLLRAELDQARIGACLIKPARQSQLYETLVSVMAGKVPAITPAPSVVASTEPGITSADLQMRILLAEDNLVNQNVARMQLAKFGYQVDIVANGKEAVTTGKSGNYDVIFMDCQMPELDGYEASRQLRAWEHERRDRGEVFTPLHIIAMTANAMQGDREICFAAGMDDYITKPVRQSELAASLARTPGALL